MGTDREELLEDPLYLGYRHARLRGAEYDAFVEAFVERVARFSRAPCCSGRTSSSTTRSGCSTATGTGSRSFNDDIQGTAAVVLAGILAAMRAPGRNLRDQRLVLPGPGPRESGWPGSWPGHARRRGVARGRAHAHRDDRLTRPGLRRPQPSGRGQARFALPADALARSGFSSAPGYDLETVIRQVAPTILIGTTATAGAFSEIAIREMAARTPVPIVFPLSNPTSQTEAVPMDILAWSDGRALVATGSP